MVAALWSRRAVALISVLGLALVGTACGDDAESSDKDKSTTTTVAGSPSTGVTAVPGGPATIDQDLSGLDAELGQLDEELADLDQGVSAQGGVGQ